MAAAEKSVQCDCCCPLPCLMYPAADLEKSRRVIERLEAAVARVPVTPASAPVKAVNEAENPASKAADAVAGPSTADDAASSPLSVSASRSPAVGGTNAASASSRGDRLVEEGTAGKPTAVGVKHKAEDGGR